MITRRVKLGIAGAAVAIAGLGVGVAAFAASAQVPKFAALSGENEVGGGDPDGRGSATFIIEDGQLCFGIAVANITTPTAAHVHAGKKHENGPVVVGLAPPSTGDPGASSGCVTITEEVAGAIRSHPSQFYVNVHTADFPGGAVRGQVFLHKP
jgi:hypothetical protein